MASSKLTDRQIRTAKPGANVLKLSDGGGLQLWVMPTGGKLWRIAYRYGARQRMIALGRYPDVGLADARSELANARASLAKGMDPGLVKKIGRATSFNFVADEWLDRQRRDGRSDATLEKNLWILSLARSVIGPRPIGEITSAECAVVLRDIELSGRLETARRTRAIMGAVFRFAIATARAENDPTVALRGAVAAPRVKHRAAMLDRNDFGGVLRSVWEYEGQPQTRAALMLCILLAPRPGELRLSTWDEFDLPKAKWTAPPGRMKMRRPHEAPLSRQTIEILLELHQVTGRSRLLFPSLRDRTRPISEVTMNAALRRMGFTKDEVTPHGFRATFATLANESNMWNPDAIERHLAHKDRDEVRAAYARGVYWDERVRLAQWWADQCDIMRVGGEVIPLAARRA